MKKKPKQSICITLSPHHIEMVNSYSVQTGRSKSAVIDAMLREALSAREQKSHFHTRLLERLGTP